MHRIAMEIGATGHQQPEIGGHLAVAFDRSLVVIRVVDLERVETGHRERRDLFVDARPPWMGERGNSSRAMNDADDDVGWRSWSAHKSRAVVTEKSIERFLRIRDVASPLNRARDLRPPDGTPQIALPLVEQRLQVDGHAELGKPRRDHVYALDPRLALIAQELEQPWFSRVEEIREHVNVTAALDRGDLDSRMCLDSARRGQRLNFAD